MAERSEIDRLIEEGLGRYGAGDIDAALVLWEEALAIDPENAQALSYVEYVRENYELLSTTQPGVATGGDFGLDDEPEYQIEIFPGELAPDDTAPIRMDPQDPSWYIEDAKHAGSPVKPPRGEDKRDEPEGFDDSTQEYHGMKRPSAPPARRAQSEFGAEPTNEFSNQPTPGFMEDTGVRKRDLGFVQPAGSPPEPKVLIGNAPTMDVSALTETQQVPATPRMTRELPEVTRAPARRDSQALSQAEVVLNAAPTRDISKVPVDIGAPTRELGLRPPPKRLPSVTDEDEPTKQSDVRAIRSALANEPLADATKHDLVLPFDPIDARAGQILDEVDVSASVTESKENQTRRRITALCQKANEYSASGDLERAVTAADLALAEDPNSALGQKLITRNKDAIMNVFQAYLGDLQRMPSLARPLQELSNAPINPRAAFLLSRIDGTLTLDELLDVSGMPRLEAYRHLCQLYLRGILR